MVDIIIAIIIYVIIAGGFYMFYRNNKTKNFKLKILDIASKACLKNIKNHKLNWEQPFEVFEKYSYDQMLFSFKPLTLEAWFTDEEIKILKGDEQ